MSDTAHETKNKPKLSKPKQYTILFKNDDFTPVGFVISVLVNILNIDAFEAEKITMNIHKSGRGNAGTYTYEVAQMKVAQVIESAKIREYPLTCSAEPL